MAGGGAGSAGFGLRLGGGFEVLSTHVQAGASAASGFTAALLGASKLFSGGAGGGISAGGMLVSAPLEGRDWDGTL